MGLGLSTESGSNFEARPYVKYDAKAGRMFKVDRSQATGAWANEVSDITNNAIFVMDLAGIEVGWISFGAPPSFVMTKLGQPLPARPDVDHRQGFRVQLFSDKNLDGVREWSHNAKCVIQSMDAFYDVYKSAPEAAQGKLPVVQMTGVNPVVTSGPKGNTTNYAPIFSILQWVDRPAAMANVPAPQTIQQNTTPTNGLAAPVAAAAFNAPLAASGNGPIF